MAEGVRKQGKGRERTIEDRNFIYWGSVYPRAEKVKRVFGR
jgi:hypothetical protein